MYLVSVVGPLRSAAAGTGESESSSDVSSAHSSSVSDGCPDATSKKTPQKPTYEAIIGKRFLKIQLSRFGE
jgi:hypothetical protein